MTVPWSTKKTRDGVAAADRQAGSCSTIDRDVDFDQRQIAREVDGLTGKCGAEIDRAARIGVGLGDGIAQRDVVGRARPVASIGDDVSGLRGRGRGPQKRHHQGDPGSHDADEAL